MSKDERYTWASTHVSGLVELQIFCVLAASIGLTTAETNRLCLSQVLVSGFIEARDNPPMWRANWRSLWNPADNSLLCPGLGRAEHWPCRCP